jgi:hypothetical protein
MLLTWESLLGDSPAEIRHLVEQAQVYAAEASELFDAITVPAGSVAIDVGCGAIVQPLRG